MGSYLNIHTAPTPEVEGRTDNNAKCDVGWPINWCQYYIANKQNMSCRHLLRLLILLTVSISITRAQQSAAGQDTLIGIVGRDFIMMGADSSSSGGGLALTSSDIDKIAVLHDGKGVSSTGVGHDSRRQSLEQQAIAIGFAGDAADGKKHCAGDTSYLVKFK